MRIDSHQHFWKVVRGDYFWMSPAVPTLYRDYLPEDLRPILARHGIDRTILVQAARTVAETDFLLDLARKNNFIGGVVGWLDMDSKDFPDQFERYCQNPKFIGLRPMLQDISEDDWILRPRVIESLKLLAKKDFPFDFLTYTRHLPYVLKSLEEVPNLRAVIDHLSKPEIKAQVKEPWKSLISEVARHKNVYCKLSGLITEADHKNWTTSHLRPYIDHAVKCFGLDRVMYGSDWPPCLLAGTYDEVIGTLRSMLEPHLDQRSEMAVFGGNAARFYRVN
jgi:L-fuconolactonase